MAPLPLVVHHPLTAVILALLLEASFLIYRFTGMLGDVITTGRRSWGDLVLPPALLVLYLVGRD